MPTKKLIDIIDEMNLKENKILDKFLELSKLIESKNPSMDDSELRWVETQIQKFDEGSDNYGKPITKNDLLSANFYWKKYNN